MHLVKLSYRYMFDVCHPRPPVTAQHELGVPDWASGDQSSPQVLVLVGGLPATLVLPNVLLLLKDIICLDGTIE